MPTTHHCERINCSGVHSYKKITETEPLTRHKSNNLVYDGTFYWIDNNLSLKCSQKYKMPYYSKCNQDLIFEINHFRSIYQIKWNALTKICGGMCGWAVNTSNSESGGLGFKPRPLRCFHRQETLLHFFSPHPGI